MKEESMLVEKYKRVQVVKGTIKGNVILESTYSVDLTKALFEHQSAEWWGHKHGFV